MQGEIVVWNKYGYFDATADAASQLMSYLKEQIYTIDQFSDLLMSEIDQEW